MSATNPRRRVASTFCALLLTSACFHSTAPRGWLPKAEEAQQEAYGGWVRVDYKVGVTRRTVEGELIAAAADSVHVLTADTIVAVATGSMIGATLTTYDAQLGTLRLWTALGAISSLSHGFAFVLTMPVWVIAGTSATASASRAPRIQSTNPILLHAYARFPQGLPPGLDPRSLQQKDVRALARH